MSAAPPPFHCPRCRAAVAREGEAWACAACGASYPILCGIPDFRLAPDPYLSLEEERAKAARLYAFAASHGFAETLAEYYRITDDVPPDMARRFAAYVLAGEARGRVALARLGAPDGALLDAGCGAGGLVLAAARAGEAAVGLDIALRWLVIARKRLEEEGLAATLACADLLAPPFAPGAFGRAAAADLVEHLPDAAAGARALHDLLAPGGRLHATGANRFTLAAYPPAGLRGVGFLPRGLRRRYVTMRRGIDTLRHLAPLSPGGLARELRRAGFEAVAPLPLAIPPERAATLGGLQRRVAPAYARLREAPVAGRLLLALGPAFEITARRPERAGDSGEDGS